MNATSPTCPDCGRQCNNPDAVARVACAQCGLIFPTDPAKLAKALARRAAPRDIHEDTGALTFYQRIQMGMY